MTISISRALVFMFVLCGVAMSQGPAGGRLPEKKSTSTPPPKTTAPKTPARAAGLDRIDGKWWTTGNDFGAGELELEQSGASVSGTIRWSDGRTGTLNGTLVGKRLQHTFTTSTGESGSGWLELSWANFLGGAWKSQQVRNGSWTLNRIEGQWCLNGNKSRVRRVTTDPQGRLLVVGVDERFGGHMEGSYMFIEDGTMSIKGDMFYKGNRIDFANGNFWTWCGK